MGAAGYLPWGVVSYSLEEQLMLSRAVTEEPSTHLLQTSPASWLTLPAPPAKDKADDRGEGKNQICKSTKHINLFGPSERGKNSSAGASHLASFARSLLL